MTASTKMRAHVTGAVLAAFAIRLFFILKFPFSDAGDTPLYQALAHNMLAHGTYGISVFGKLTPVDMRTPGYPAFLATIYAIFGESTRVVMVAQAAVDVLTCIIVAAMAAMIAPRESRRCVAFAALWLAAICPFTANYTAVLLTEPLATFLTALALLVLMEAMRGENLRALDSAATGNSPGELKPEMRWLLGGIVTGFGALVRPEGPLLLAGPAIVLLGYWRRPKNWPKLARAGALMGFGLILPLAPWAARNWRTLHRVQFLAPAYSELPDEYTPHGFFSWEKTWLWRFRDVFLVSWNLGSDRIEMDDLPAAAFDSPAERERVANLLAQYNASLEMSADIDGQFAEIARERTARHPLRTYAEVPALRALAMWFTPRVEMLPLSGKFWPVGYWWEDSPSQYCYSFTLFVMGIAYGVLALLGAWRCRKDPVVWMLVAFIVVRTAFLTTIETPEPRYVLECFPAVFALGAQLWAKRNARAMPDPNGTAA
ncbi:MAG TPA: hypothetical protein VGR81_10010 [Candidatus Acidoferrales bacterium]|nr:hypothetical protein [Candidatus Acidoferrales bacterium]